MVPFPSIVLPVIFNSEILAMVDKSFLSDEAKKLYKANVVENYKLFEK